MARKTETSYEKLLVNLQRRINTIRDSDTDLAGHQLRQTDFANGTVEITTPGYYQFQENISFNPEPIPSGGNFYDGPLINAAALQTKSNAGKNGFTIGWFAAIAVSFQTDGSAGSGVVIDLNGFKLDHSALHNLQQRFYSNIELASAPFNNQGPANFGSAKAAKNVMIINGTMGRSAHHQIHGNGPEDVLMQNLVFQDHEVAAISINGFKNVVVNNCTSLRHQLNVSSRTNFSFGQFLKQYLKALISTSTDASAVPGNRANAMLTYGKLTKNYQYFDNRLKYAMNQFATWTIGETLTGVTKKGTAWSDSDIDNGYWYKLFQMPIAGVYDVNRLDGSATKTCRVTGGVVYGFLFNQKGIAINAFPKNVTTPSDTLYIKSCQIENVIGNAFEQPAFRHAGKEAKDPIGAVISLFMDYPKNFAKDGSIEKVTVENGGAGYYIPPAVTFSGSPATATVAEAIVSASNVVDVKITQEGFGYTAPAVSFSGGGGTGATASVTVYDGGVSSVNIGAAGSGYTSVPTVSITGGGGSNAAATATISGGAIEEIIVTATGSGYTTPTVTIVAPHSGTQAVGKALMEGGSTGVANQGKITSVIMTNAGDGYGVVGTVAAPSSGTTATISVSVSSTGVIDNIYVVNGGSGYTSDPSITLTSGSSTSVTTAASVTARVETSDSKYVRRNENTSLESVIVSESANNANKSFESVINDSIPFIRPKVDLSLSGTSEYFFNVLLSAQTIVLKNKSYITTGGITTVGTNLPLDPRRGAYSRTYMDWVQGRTNTNGLLSGNWGITNSSSGVGAGWYSSAAPASYTYQNVYRSSFNALTGLYDKRQFLNGILKDYFTTDEKINIWSSVGSPADPVFDNDDLSVMLPECSQTKGSLALNGDAMHHVSKPNIGIKADGVNNVFIDNVILNNIINFGDIGRPYCCHYQKSHRLQNLEGYNGAGTRGMTFSSSFNVIVNSVKYQNSLSAWGDNIAIDILFDTDIVSINALTINSQEAGFRYDAVGNTVYIINCMEGKHGARRRYYRENPTPEPLTAAIKVSDLAGSVAISAVKINLEEGKSNLLATDFKKQRMLIFDRRKEIASINPTL